MEREEREGKGVGGFKVRSDAAEVETRIRLFGQVCVGA